MLLRVNPPSGVCPRDQSLCSISRCLGSSRQRWGSAENQASLPTTSSRCVDACPAFSSARESLRRKLNLLWPVDGLLLLVHSDQLLERVCLLQARLLSFVQIKQSDCVLLLLMHPLWRCNSLDTVNARSHRCAFARAQRIWRDESMLQCVGM